MADLPSPTPEQIELFWTYNSPNVVLMSLAWFLIVKKITVPDKIGSYLANLTACGFGIYMVHYFFVRAGYEFALFTGVPVWLQIPVSALAIFALSWFTSIVMLKIFGKWSVYFLGIKQKGERRESTQSVASLQ